MSHSKSLQVNYNVNLPVDTGTPHYDSFHNFTRGQHAVQEDHTREEPIFAPHLAPQENRLPQQQYPQPQYHHHRHDQYQTGQLGYHMQNGHEEVPYTQPPYSYQQQTQPQQFMPTQTSMRHLALSQAPPTTSALPVAAPARGVHAYSHALSGNFPLMQGVNIPSANANPQMMAQFTPQLRYPQLAYDHERHQRQLRPGQGMVPDVLMHHHANMQPRPSVPVRSVPVQGMYGYPTYIQPGNMLNPTCQDQFTVPNANYNPQTRYPATTNELYWQVQRPPQQHQPCGMLGYYAPMHQNTIHSPNRTTTNMGAAVPPGPDQQAQIPQRQHWSHGALEPDTTMHRLNVPDVEVAMPQNPNETYATGTVIAGEVNNPVSGSGQDMSIGGAPDMGLEQAQDFQLNAKSTHFSQSPQDLETIHPSPTFSFLPMATHSNVNDQPASPKTEPAAPQDSPKPATLPIVTATSEQFPETLAALHTQAPVDALQTPKKPLYLPRISNLSDHTAGPFRELARPGSPLAAPTAVAVFQKNWGLFYGDVHRSLGTEQSCKRTSRSKPEEVATEVAPQRKRSRTEEQGKQQGATPGGVKRRKTAPASANSSEGRMKTLRYPEIATTAEIPVNDDASCLRTQAPTPTTTRINHLTDAAPTSDVELTVTKADVLTPISSASTAPTTASDDEVTITGINILTPPPSVSPLATKSITSTTTNRPVPKVPCFPKPMGKPPARTTTHAGSITASYDILRANKQLAYNLPSKIAMNRKRWITNPEEYPSLGRPMEQGDSGVKQRVEDPDAVFEVNERGERVLPASITPQGDAAVEPEGAQNEEINPYEDSDNEVSWQGSGELVIEEEVTRGLPVQAKAPPAIVVPTPPIPSASTSPPKKGRGVKLTEEEKKARRKQRDRERYQRRKEEAGRLKGAKNTPSKNNAHPSPVAPKGKGVTKRTSGKSRHARIRTPPDAPQQELLSEELVLAQYRAQEARRMQEERYDANTDESSDEDMDDDEGSSRVLPPPFLKKFPAAEAQRQEPVEYETEESSDEDEDEHCGERRAGSLPVAPEPISHQTLHPDESSDEDEDEDKENGEFNIWDQIGLAIQDLPPVDLSAKVVVDDVSESHLSVGWSSEGKQETNAGEPEVHSENLPLPGIAKADTDGEGEMSVEGDDDHDLDYLFEE